MLCAILIRSGARLTAGEEGSEEGAELEDAGRCKAPLGMGAGSADALFTSADIGIVCLDKAYRLVESLPCGSDESPSTQAPAAVEPVQAKQRYRIVLASY